MFGEFCEARYQYFIRLIEGFGIKGFSLGIGSSRYCQADKARDGFGKVQEKIMPNRYILMGEPITNKKLFLGVSRALKMRLFVFFCHKEDQSIT